MNTEKRVNFEDVKINTLIQRKGYIKNHILIYKVIEIDKTCYNIGLNEYSKFIKLELIQVINGDINFYLEVKHINRYMEFNTSNNKDWFAYDIYTIYNFQNIFNQIHNTNY